MNKLAKFFQETNGTFSPKRLAFLVWIFGVLIGWGFDTVHHEYKMAEIPQLGQVLIAVLMTGKVAQKFGEEDSNTGTTTVQVIEEKRQLISNADDNTVATRQGQ